MSSCLFSPWVLAEHVRPLSSRRDNPGQSFHNVGLVEYGRSTRRVPDSGVLGRLLIWIVFPRHWYKCLDKCSIKYNDRASAFIVEVCIFTNQQGLLAFAYSGGPP